MTVITVKMLQEVRKSIENGTINHGCVRIEGGLEVKPDAIEWVKRNHYQLKVVETFGPTGIALIIFPAE